MHPFMSAQFAWALIWQLLVIWISSPIASWSLGTFYTSLVNETCLSSSPLRLGFFFSQAGNHYFWLFVSDVLFYKIGKLGPKRYGPMNWQLLIVFWTFWPSHSLIFLVIGGNFAAASPVSFLLPSSPFIYTFFLLNTIICLDIWKKKERYFLYLLSKMFFQVNVSLSLSSALLACPVSLFDHLDYACKMTFPVLISNARYLGYQYITWLSMMFLCSSVNILWKNCEFNVLLIYLKMLIYSPIIPHYF